MSSKVKRLTQLVTFDPPPMKWSSAMFRKTVDRDGEQATKAGRDCHEAGHPQEPADLRRGSAFMSAV